MTHLSVGGTDNHGRGEGALSSVCGVQPGKSVNMLLASEEMQGRLAIIETLELQGCGPPLHIHNNEDEVVYVLDGEVTFIVEGRRIDGRKGTSVLLPKGQEHCYTVESACARLLVLLMPGGLDSYYLELSLVSERPSASPGTELDVERVVTMAARYDIEITGPRRGRDVD